MWTHSVYHDAGRNNHIPFSLVCFCFGLFLFYSFVAIVNVVAFLFSLFFVVFFFSFCFRLFDPFWYIQILPVSPLSKAWAPLPLLPPAKDWYPVLPVVEMDASHCECLDVTVSTPPPPPAIIKGVFVLLTTNEPPPPPEVVLTLLIPPSWPTSIWMISPFLKLNVPIILAPLPLYCWLLA